MDTSATSPSATHADQDDALASRVEVPGVGQHQHHGAEQVRGVNDQRRQHGQQGVGAHQMALTAAADAAAVAAAAVVAAGSTERANQTSGQVAVRDVIDGTRVRQGGVGIDPHSAKGPSDASVSSAVEDIAGALASQPPGTPSLSQMGGRPVSSPASGGPGAHVSRAGIVSGGAIPMGASAVDGSKMDARVASLRASLGGDIGGTMLDDVTVARGATSMWRYFDRGEKMLRTNKFEANCHFCKQHDGRLSRVRGEKRMMSSHLRNCAFAPDGAKQEAERITQELKERRASAGASRSHSMAQHVHHARPDRLREVQAQQLQNVQSFQTLQDPNSQHRTSQTLHNERSPSTHHYSQHLTHQQAMQAQLQQLAPHPVPSHPQSHLPAALSHPSRLMPRQGSHLVPGNERHLAHSQQSDHHNAQQAARVHPHAQLSSAEHLQSPSMHGPDSLVHIGSVGDPALDGSQRKRRKSGALGRVGPSPSSGTMDGAHMSSSGSSVAAVAAAAASAAAAAAAGQRADAHGGDIEGRRQSGLSSQSGLPPSLAGHHVSGMVAPEAQHAAAQHSYFAQTTPDVQEASTCGMLVTNDGVHLYYETKGSGHPLILIHGWSGSSKLFLRNYDALAESFRVIRFDLRGHGESDTPNQGFHVARFAVDLLNVMDHFGLNRVALLGCSLGCAVIWSFVELFGSERISAAMFVDQSPWQLYAADGSWTLGSKGFFSEAAVANLSACLQLDPQSCHVGTVKACLTRTATPEEEAFFVTEGLKAKGWFLAKLMADHNNIDWRATLPLVTCPALVIAGKQSKIFPWEGVAYAANVMPNAKLIAFDEGSHWLYYEEAERFNSVIKAFLGKIVSATS